MESNVKYVKDNCFKGRDFKDIEAAQVFLSGWLADTANSRIHGTTGRIPAKVFHELESAELRPLPEEEFLFTKSEKALVRTDCHIVHGGNYYSVPHSYIRMEEDVIEVNGLVKIYYEGKKIALHSLVRNAKGEHRADNSFRQKLKKYTASDLLILDEFGLKKLGQTNVDDLYEVIPAGMKHLPPSSPPTSSLMNGETSCLTRCLRQPSLIVLCTTAVLSSLKEKATA